MLSYGWKSDGQRGWTLQKYENNVNAQIESLHFFFTAMQGYPWCGGCFSECSALGEAVVCVKWHCGLLQTASVH